MLIKPMQLSLWLFLVLTGILSAQELPAAKEITLEATGISGRILPLGTTANNNFVVFYDHGDSSSYPDSPALKARVVRPNGGMSKAIVIAERVYSPN